MLPRHWHPHARTLAAALSALVVVLLLAACAGCDAQRLDARGVDPVVALDAALPAVPTTTTVAPLPPPRPAHRTSRAAPTRQRSPLAPPIGDLSALLDRLADCESGRNPKASGRFHGAFQFMLSTWRSLGGTGLPEQHGYEEQKAIAARIPVSAWHSQFPVCSRRIGV